MLLIQERVAANSLLRHGHAGRPLSRVDASPIEKAGTGMNKQADSHRRAPSSPLRLALPCHSQSGREQGPGSIKRRSKFNGVEISFCAVSTRTQCYESRSEMAYPPAAHPAAFRWFGRRPGQPTASAGWRWSMARMWAIFSRSSRRSQMKSTAPFSCRNSAR